MEELSRVDDLIKHQDPDDVAVIYNGQRYKYKCIRKGMMQVAANLQWHNVYTDKIIVLLGNRPEAIMAIMGISYIGGTFIPVPDNISAEKLNGIIIDSGASTIITDEKHEPIMEGLSNDIDTFRIALDIDNLKEFPGIRLAQSKPKYPASLMYTSGTTGKPKGVICPHHKIMAAVSSINEYMLHTHRDVIATALPLSHGYGLYQVFSVFAEGGTVLLENNFSYPAKTLEQIKCCRATGFAAVPSMIHMLMQLDGWDQYFDSVEYVTTAGAALSSVTFEKLLTALPHCEIIPMYGQTECVRALAYPGHVQRKFNGARLNSCGIPIPGTETKLLTSKISNEGELLIHSPHVMDGYWNSPEETAKTFVKNWLHTGDIFGIDENGLHYFIGRNDDIVKIKGERCTPVELDNALMSIPGVTDAAAFAVSDRIWGNRFIAYVSTDDVDFDRNIVMRYCKKNLEAYLMPKDVVIVGNIPKNDNGKVSRPLLKKLYEEIKYR